MKGENVCKTLIGIQDKNGRWLLVGDTVRCYGGEYCQGRWEHDETFRIGLNSESFLLLENSEYIEFKGDVLKVNLTYFKVSGKYYIGTSYRTEHESLLDIWKEVENMRAEDRLPGLKEGLANEEFTILVDVPEHTDNHPHLLFAFTL